MFEKDKQKELSDATREPPVLDSSCEEKVPDKNSWGEEKTAQNSPDTAGMSDKLSEQKITRKEISFGILVGCLSYLPILKIPLFLFSYSATGFLLYKIWPQGRARPEEKSTNDHNLFVLGLSEILLISLALLLGREAGAFLAYWTSMLFALAWYRVKIQKKSIFWNQLIQAAVMSTYVVSSFNTKAWAFPFLIMLIFYGVGVLMTLSTVFGLRVAAILYYVCIVTFEVVSILFHNYRYANITISDVLSLSTFLNVAGSYHFTWDSTMAIYIVGGTVCLLPFLFVKGEKIKGKIKMAVIGGMITIVSFLGIGYRTYIKWDTDHAGTTYFDIFAASVVDDIKIRLDAPDIEEQKKKVKQYEPDLWGDGQIKPNIITVMCESYSDLVEIRNLTVNRNPVEPLWELGKTDPHAKTGLVQIHTIGGGTSVSEWEYQMGLNHSKLSASRVPFFSDMKKNYSFSADPLYSDYYKLYMHPYKSSSWNRVNVYKTLQFDETLFSETGDTTYGDADRVRNLVSDKALLSTIEKRMEETEQPLFSMNVTMQNHGAYTDDVGGEHALKEKTIEIFDDVIDKNEAENYMTLIDMSTDAILDFVGYLKEHPEEPTLLIFFGDHEPTALDMPDDQTGYHTPYLIYSNFCKLSDVPEEMDLSLLYANAIKAAGLPLSSWEKYLLSLGGETADRSMIIARIKGGYF